MALSGGGVRGLAHIGVLHVLGEAAIPIHAIAGTSMGGFIGAAFAAGLSAHELEEEALRVCAPRQLLGLIDHALPRRGLLVGQRVTDYMAQWLGEFTFADLCIPLALVAVDLNSGQRIVMREGSVLEAVRATTARQTINLLADRLYHNRLLGNSLAGLVEVLGRSLVIMTNEINRHNLAAYPPDLLLQPAIPPGVTVVSGFNLAKETIEAGKVAAIEALPAIRQLLRG